MQKNQDQFASKKNVPGRPSRHESEGFKTIAWYSFLAGDSPPKIIASWPEFVHVDLTTIYRYRRGQISPSKDFIALNHEGFQAARNVYDVGPLLVPLWDAMWGEISFKDMREASVLLPNGSWGASVVYELLYENPLYARVKKFRDMIVREERVTSDLEVFSTAIRTSRAWQASGEGDLVALRELLLGTMALPGAYGLLADYHLLVPMQRWVDRLLRESETPESAEVYRGSFGPQ